MNEFVKQKHRVRTRLGKKIEQLTEFNMENDKSVLVGILDCEIETWTEDGRYIGAYAYPHTKDLVLSPIEQTYYVLKTSDGLYHHKMADNDEPTTVTDIRFARQFPSIDSTHARRLINEFGYTLHKVTFKTENV